MYGKLFNPKDIPDRLRDCFEEVETICGAPWVRVVEKSGGTIGQSWHDHKEDLEQGQRVQDKRMADGSYKTKTLGWRPTCSCGHKETVPCVVLDCFCGSGTTAEVAIDLDRSFFGMDLNGDYLKKFAQPRIDQALERQKARQAQGVLGLKTEGNG